MTFIEEIFALPISTEQKSRIAKLFIEEMKKSYLDGLINFKQGFELYTKITGKEELCNPH